MIKNSLLITLASLLALSANASASASAQAQCTLEQNATPSQTKRYTQCLDTQINQAKYNQGTWVQKRKYELTKLEEQSGNTQILMLFKRSVDNHQKYIEASCQWRYILKLPNASQAAIDYKLCELALIEQFTQVLKKPL
ncbi:MULTISPECIES: hypothetical protein [Pseudoalteromonas]|jgi:hypothetical protein|uniref:hypothetical protein n=2 Tax=Pseudoalteromonas TaxID=53246 RepID=UPI0002C994DD|nr:MULTISPECIES: hypothetical protein [Pseudoalteromonas]ENO00045.1 hypothetical protein J139_05595 [Pseudoalteromonas agarivorans S816]ETJ47156.1 hypothetical protein X564_14770 [Pseudoalteromonas agarivorans]MDI3245931.1 hypothetical protein [Pseudoalteromonas agarivorans]TMP17837.1 hypothetical protein CWC04_06845 [Pseudoalteromonas sp. S2893]TMS65045.1 hypothetical protein CWB83_14710 [Pseudoalteromonas sp. S1691]|tara:strand:+ start:16755 stop:17171 length:417 start_codon:yes stop_codon:yes gene_type:complete